MTRKGNSEWASLKKELANLRRLRTKGYATPFGRIRELERYFETRGASHGQTEEQHYGTPNSEDR